MHLGWKKLTEVIEETVLIQLGIQGKCFSPLRGVHLPFTKIPGSIKDALKRHPCLSLSCHQSPLYLQVSRMCTPHTRQASSEFITLRHPSPTSGLSYISSLDRDERDIGLSVEKLWIFFLLRH